MCGNLKTSHLSTTIAEANTQYNRRLLHRRSYPPPLHHPHHPTALPNPVSARVLLLESASAPPRAWLFWPLLHGTYTVEEDLRDKPLSEVTITLHSLTTWQNKRYQQDRMFPRWFALNYLEILQHLRSYLAIRAKLRAALRIDHKAGLEYSVHFRAGFTSLVNALC